MTNNGILVQKDKYYVTVSPFLSWYTIVNGPLTYPNKEAL